MTQEWTPERTATLISLWNTGVRASEIARRMGITKNAVIGKVFRLQLPRRRPSTPAEADDQNLSRWEWVGTGGCSWPLGEIDQAGFHFCGATAVPGKPYCSLHCRLAYLPTANKRRITAVA